MRFRFDNGLIFGQAPYELQSPISGLDTPKMRNADGVYAGADGGYMISQLYGARTIVLKGFFIGNCPATTSELRQNLLSKLYIRYYSTIIIEDFAENYWITRGYISDIKCDLTSAKVGEYQITIICPDPAIYSANDWSDTEPTPHETNLTIGTQVSILRVGDMEAYPTITLSGEFTNPIISIGDLSFGLNLTTDASSKIVIDMKARTVKAIDGSSLAEYRLVDSRWLSLSEGVNSVLLETESSGDTGTAKLNYYAGYRGV